ncbi:MAG: vWA domain-containing protein [Deltaproteobacteria bacterium]|jgi:hypothetical protein
MQAKHKTLGLFAAALGMVAIAAIVPEKPNTPAPNPPNPHPIHVTDVKPVTDAERPLVQVALLLDTSSSMDGLIDQARSELWRIVGQLSEGKRNGKAPRLQLALYEYGNDGLPAGEGYIRQVVGLTGEIDRVSEALFALRTNGGQEYAGLAIRNALVALPWSEDEDALKLIFVAGNEGFNQGPVASAEAIALAKKQGVTVNPIFCGAEQAGIAQGWQTAAMLAGGFYLTIDHNQAVAQIAAPQDAELAKLNTAINGTYIPYGVEGAAGFQRQAAQDANSSGYGLANLATRGSFKASANYRNDSWELVDALDQGRVKLDDLKETGLPAAMKGMTKGERAAYVAAKKAERDTMKKRIRDLTKEREAFVAAERKKLGQEDSLDVAMLGAVKKLAGAKGLSFE